MLVTSVSRSMTVSVTSKPSSNVRPVVSATAITSESSGRWTRDRFSRMFTDR